MSELAKHFERIIKAAVPIAKLTDREIAMVIITMTSSDGTRLLNQLPVGHIALLRAEESGRSTVIFSNQNDIDAFANRYGLVELPKEA